MAKNFVANLAFLLLVNLLVKPAYIFGIDLGIQNAVDSQIYGDYFMLFNLTFLFQIVLDLGITNYNNKTISQQPEKLSSYIGGILSLKGMLFLAYIGLTFSAASILGFELQAFYWLMILSFNQFLLSMTLYMRSNVAALQLFKKDALLSILDRILMILVLAPLLYVFAVEEFKITWFLLAQFFAYLITFLTAFFVVIKKVKIQFSLPNFQLFKTILSESYPFAILVLLMGFYNRMDGVMLKALLEADFAEQQAAIYAGGYRIYEAANMFGYLFASILLPMFAKMLSKKEDISPLVQMGFKLIWVLSVVIGIQCFFYQTEMITLVLDEANAYWGEVFGWLILSFIPVCSVYIFGSLLTANGSLKHLNIIAISGVVINLIINLIFIPKYGALGAAKATFITQVVVAILHVILAIFVLKLSFNIKYWLQLAFFIILFILMNDYLSENQSNFYLNLFIQSIVGVVLAFVLKLIQIQDIKDVLQLVSNKNK